ncbi:MAG: glycoside hydrolase family 15 protein [Candidatus Babeliales bacterium]
MTRLFVLGNRSILIDLDRHGQVRDFYYPFVGQENHVNSQIHRIGFWIEGQFSWLSSTSWQKELSYKKDTLTTNIVAENKELNILVQFNDIVVHDCDIFIRKLTILNKADYEREIRVFFHQKFDIFESNIGDTVFYNPFIKAIVHYKGKRYFLASGLFEENGIKRGIMHYATGLAGEYGREGTYVDARDGQLSENPIEHGAVDSTIEFCIPLKAKKSHVMHYWLCAGKDLGEVSQLNGYIEKSGPSFFCERTEKYWIEWANRTPFKFFQLSDDIINLFKRSLLVISSHVDQHGSIIASSDSDVLFYKRDTYSYMWPRDGALIVRSLDRSGYPEITEKFFRFCLKALTPFGYLFHKYRPDGSWGSSWHSWVEEGHIQLPIQEDQIGLVIDALWKHCIDNNKPEYMKDLCAEFVQKVADFMLEFIDEKTGLPKESYDVWEEKLGIHTYTCCAVYAGLKAAAQFEALWGTHERAKACEERAEIIRNTIIKELYDEEKGYFIKGLYYQKGQLKKNMTNDASSFYGVFEFHILPVDDERVRSSYEYMKKGLKNQFPIGGYARYEGDNYFREECTGAGNPWFITTMWLAEYYIAKAKSLGDLKPAVELFEWVVKRSLSTGILPEQLEPCSGLPLSVAPLTWSHAGYIIAIVKYLEKLDDLGICAMCSPPGLKRKKGNSNQ